MSRLDYFINRMVSQRACLDFAAKETASLDGPVFELGLGNGRTFDHMREIMPERDIYVFDRHVESNPASTPKPEQMILGDVRETAGEALKRFGDNAILIHADLGGHNLEKNDAFAREISQTLEPLLGHGGIFISSDKMYFENLEEMPIPDGAVKGRCFLYRRS